MSDISNGTTDEERLYATQVSDIGLLLYRLTSDAYGCTYSNKIEKKDDIDERQE